MHTIAHSPVFAYGVGTWHRHKVADGSKISIVLHSRRVSHTECNYAQLATKGFCTIRFSRSLHICVFIVCTNKASTGLLPEVQLLHLIIKHWGGGFAQHWWAHKAGKQCWRETTYVSASTRSKNILTTFPEYPNLPLKHLDLFFNSHL